MGPNASFTNDEGPRGKRQPARFLQTKLREGCSICSGACRRRLDELRAAVLQTKPPFLDDSNPAAAADRRPTPNAVPRPGNTSPLLTLLPPLTDDPSPGRQPQVRRSTPAPN